MNILNTLLTAQKGKVTIASVLVYLFSDKAEAIVNGLEVAPTAFAEGMTNGVPVVQVISAIFAVLGFIRKGSATYKSTK